jgi:nanoRNase/pAp phosphatase (c-di-AMP/oligoRNAs hydrolase)
MSVSQPVSDYLNYKHPNFTIIIAYLNGNSAKFSLRSPLDIRTAMLNVLKNIDGAKGGGHKNSCGAQITVDNLDFFKENLLKEIEKLRKD